MMGLFGHWLLRAMEYQWLNTHFLAYACTQGPSLVENGTTAAMRPWGQTKLPFLAKVHICDARMNTKTHILTDSMWWPFLMHFAFQLRALLWTLENHLFFSSRVTLIDMLAKPRGHTQTNSKGTQETHAYIYITTACLNFRTQWKYYCSVTLLKWCLCVRPKLAFEYANASAGSNLERRGALMWSTSSLNQAAMLAVTQLHWSHSLYATANTHTFSDTATFAQILIQTCQTDNSHHGTIWLNELKWMRNEMKNREGKKEWSFCAGISLWEVQMVEHIHTPVRIRLCELLLYQVNAFRMRQQWCKTSTHDCNTESSVALTSFLFLSYFPYLSPKLQWM